MFLFMQTFTSKGERYTITKVGEKNIGGKYLALYDLAKEGVASAKNLFDHFELLEKFREDVMQALRDEGETAELRVLPESDDTPTTPAT